MNSKFALHNPHLAGDSFCWEGGPVGVLLAHGYTATTAEVRLLGRCLHEEGYTVAGPLLPGHGTTPAAMNRCRWPDWVAGVEESYQALAARCEQAFVGGESMGALLALFLARNHPEVMGILAYSPALRIPLKPVVLSHLLGPVVPFVVKKNIESFNKNWQGYLVHPMRALVQLYRLQRATDLLLAHIRQPLLIVQGRLDTAIDLRGVDLLYQKIGSPIKELHWLEQSEHVVMLDNELEQVVDLTIRFMAQVLDHH